MSFKMLLSVLLAVLPFLSVADAADWYAGPQGAPKNAGSPQSPWDIASALDGSHKIAPGDTLYLLAGVYKRRPHELFDVKLAGTQAKPIHVRPAPGARATIDGGLAVLAPAAHVWIWNLEILVSEPLPAAPVSAGSHPDDFKRPWGGLHGSGGRNCKYIHLVIHDCNQGMNAWTPEVDCEIYGCLIYGNGWQGTDRGHGHCIYTQNKDGVKTIANCILAARFDGAYTLHAYGSSQADADNFLVEDNICYERGPFLIGSGKPSHNIRVFRNLLYGVGMRIGYDAPENENCEIRDNLIVNGTLTIKKYKTAINAGNLILKPGDPRPAAAKVVLLPSKYDPRRAHLAVFNFPHAQDAEVKVAPFLKAGDAFRLMDPKDFFGKPVFEGKCAGESVRVPVNGEFAAFVVLKDGPP